MFPFSGISSRLIIVPWWRRWSGPVENLCPCWEVDLRYGKCGASALKGFEAGVFRSLHFWGLQISHDARYDCREALLECGEYIRPA